MGKKYLEFMKNMDLGESVSEETIHSVERSMDIEFPKEYQTFMTSYNGAEGKLGENSYLVIWTIEEIEELNKEYGVSEFVPGLVYFGSDGGGMAYAFDMRSEKKSIVKIPFICIHIEEAVYISDSFECFIETLHNE